MELFKILGKIAVDNSEANGAIDDTTGRAENSEGRMTKAFKKIGAAVATYLAVDKIKDFGQACVEMSAEVSAEESAFEQIMGDYSDTAQKKVNEIAETTGMVSTRLTPYMTSMTAKFKGLGYDIGDATDYAQQGLNIAADAAAFWDKSLDDSMSALNSFVNGSYEGGEAIGLFANDTQMAAYAVKEGIVSESKEWAKLDEKIKQATRLEYAENMMKQSGATGQAAKESEQYANVQANLNEKWRQFKAQIGEPILQNIVLPAMEKLQDFITKKLSPGFDTLKKAAVKIKDAFKPLIERIKNAAEESGIAQKAVDFLKQAFEKAVDIVAEAGEKLDEFVGWLQGGSDGAENFKSVITGLVTAFVTYKAATTGLTAAFKIGKTVVEAYHKAQMLLNTTNPLGWAVIGVSAVVGVSKALESLPSPTEKVREEFAKLSEEEQATADKTKELKESWDSLKESRDNALSDTESEFSYYQELADELGTIVDKNGAIKEEYEDRAKVITNELSDALGIEFDMTDNVITNYDELADKIQDVITLKEAQAALDADIDSYSEAQKNISGAYDTMINAQTELQEITGQITAKQAALNAVYRMSSDEFYRIYGISADYNAVIYNLQAEIDGLTERQKEQTQTVEDAESAYSGYNSTIENHKGLSAAIVSEDVDRINDALDNMYSGFITCETGTKTSLENQVKDFKSEYDNMKKAVERGNEYITEADLKAKENQLKKAESELDKFVELHGSKAGEACDEFTEKMDSKNTELAESGKKAVDSWGNSFLDGLHSNFGQIVNTIDSYVSYLNGAAGSSSAYVNSPGDVAIIRSKLAGIPQYASGGIIDRATIAQIGEDGPEAVVPLKNNTEWIDLVADKVAKAMGRDSGGMTVNYIFENVNMNSDSDIEESAYKFEAMRQKAALAMGGT